MYFYQGITITPLVVFKGSIGVASTVPATTKASTYAPVEIIHNSCLKYHWHPVKKQEDRLTYTRVEGFFPNDLTANARFRFIDGEDHLQEEAVVAKTILVPPPPDVDE